MFPFGKVHFAKLFPDFPFSLPVIDQFIAYLRTGTFLETKTGPVTKREDDRRLQYEYEVLASESYKWSDGAGVPAEDDPYGAGGERKGELDAENLQFSLEYIAH